MVITIGVISELMSLATLVIEEGVPTPLPSAPFPDEMVTTSRELLLDSSSEELSVIS